MGSNLKSFNNLASIALLFMHSCFNATVWLLAPMSKFNPCISVLTETALDYVNDNVNPNVNADFKSSGNDV